VYDVVLGRAVWGQGFSNMGGPIQLSASQGQFATLLQYTKSSVFNYWSYDDKMPLYTLNLPPHQYPAPAHSVLYSGDGNTVVLAYEGGPWATVMWKDIFGKTEDQWETKDSYVVDMAVSVDGSYIVVDLEAKFVVLSASNASVVFMSPEETVGSSVMCASSDARYVVHGSNSKAFIRNFGADWSSPSLSQHEEVGMNFCGCAFGKNILTLLFYSDAFSAQTKIITFDINVATNKPIWVWNSEGQQPNNNPSQLSITPDGKFIALASWGTIYNNIPQLLLWSSTSSTPVASFLAAGSLYSIDMVYSGNAVRLVACGKEGHKSIAGSDGEIYVLEYKL